MIFRVMKKQSYMKAIEGIMKYPRADNISSSLLHVGHVLKPQSDLGSTYLDLMLNFIGMSGYRTTGWDLIPLSMWVLYHLAASYMKWT